MTTLTAALGIFLFVLAVDFSMWAILTLLGFGGCDVNW